MSAELVSLARLVVSNLTRRRFRSCVLMAAVGLVAAMGFLSVVLLGALEGSLVLGFERLGADLLVVRSDAQVNLTQALLAVEPEAPVLPPQVMETLEQLADRLTVSPQRAVRSDAPLSLDLGLERDTSVPLYGIDPQHDSTVLPWLEEQRGIDFQEGQVILGHRRRGRLGDRLRLQNRTFQIYGRLAPTGVPSHEQGLFFTLADLEALQPSGSADTFGINGLLIQAPAEQGIDQLRFSLLARLDGVKVVGGRTLLAMVRQGGALSLRVVAALSVALLLSVLLLLSLYSFGIAAERRQELGLLLSLGATPGQLVGLLVGETSLLCGLGGGIGLALATLLRPGLQQLMALPLSRAGLPLPDPSTAQLLRLGGWVWLLITALGAVAALLAAAALLGRDPLLLVQNDE